MQFDQDQLLALLEDHPAMAGLFSPAPVSKERLRRARLNPTLFDSGISGEVMAALGGLPLDLDADRIQIREAQAVLGNDPGTFSGKLFLIKDSKLQVVGRRTTLQAAIRRHTCASHFAELQIDEHDGNGRDVVITVRAIRRGSRRRGRKNNTGKHPRARVA